MKQYETFNRKKNKTSYNRKLEFETVLYLEE